MPAETGLALPLHAQWHAVVTARPRELFAYLDDPARLGAHMREPSWMMAGGRMNYVLDAQQGRVVGSVIRLTGRVLGMRLAVDEWVTERDPPHRKVWQTVGVPRLAVLGPYRMGFAIESHQLGSALAVFIDFALPKAGVAHWLGQLFARPYANWCVRRIATDAAPHLAQPAEAER